MLVFKTYILIQNYFHHYLLQKSPIMLLFKECMYLNVLKEELNLKEDLEFKEFFFFRKIFFFNKFKKHIKFISTSKLFY